tara:strand:- start:398 stop:643 length:246 start_codon:yes stop_codon:yes gene_type:complete
MGFEMVCGGGMQVGDLVQLSAYGKARNHNSACYGGWGFIIKVARFYSQYPITVHWYKSNGTEMTGMRFHRRELKKYKPDKK